MSPNESKNTTREMDFGRLIDAGNTLIAASGMIGALVAEYGQTGVVAVGALAYVSTMIDSVIESLDLAGAHEDLDSLPF